MVSDEALKKLQEQIAAWPMTQRFVVQQLIEDYRRNREDLRAYKATGLTPEQCENAKIIIEAAFSDDTSKAERIRELLKADKDGRLVVLPCKVGDMLYEVTGRKTISICSRCLHNEPYKNADDDDAEMFEFCPHCGAKMDGGDSDALNRR